MTPHEDVASGRYQQAEFAADRVRLQDLDEALRKFLAWKSILADKDTLDLSAHQVRQAETQRQTADSTVGRRRQRPARAHRH